MESQDIKYVGIDCGKKSLEVVRIHSEPSEFLAAVKSCWL
ncbi:Transposase [Leptospira santarosai]|nr:Transposase [Leptospira santarosai]